jgi:DNA mismatch repair protein MLH3
LQHGPFEHDDDVLSISYGPLHLSCSVLVPECIDKNCFEEARVLLQLDKKFIPVISGEVLLLVDQVCSQVCHLWKKVKFRSILSIQKS